ncbi:unnamed protein product [Echinostoma caproni]|uniref:Uncharacterized protein n=1 Tax=Echinostoma caproni TaxID=27848 RepID=A0A3P8HHI0_9TREM|nr:unnamed protein product [Echinostoma caproni]
MEDVDSVSEIGGPSNAVHGGMHSLASAGPQLYPMMPNHHHPHHHGIPDSASSGVTVLPNPNTSTVFGMMPPGTVGPGEGVGLVGQSSSNGGGGGNATGGPPTHYPAYPPLLYPNSAGAAGSGMMMNHTSQSGGIIGTGGGPPLSHMPSQMIMNSLDGNTGPGNQMLFPVDTQGYPGAVPLQFHHSHPATSQSQPLSNQQSLQPQKQATGRGNSSSSCSSQSSASSASSSSGSTASSGTRLGPTMKISGGNGTSSGPVQLTSALSELKFYMLLSYHVDLWPLDRIPGTSSASSASRQNGTGASATATGSGSGSVATGRIPSRLPPSGTGLAQTFKSDGTSRLPSVTVPGQTGSIGDLGPKTAPPVPSHATSSPSTTMGSMAKPSNAIPHRQQR